MTTPAAPDGTPPRAVILDVDGTMYHQGPLRRAMLGRLLRHAARRPLAGARTMRVLQAYRRAQEQLRHGGDTDPARQLDVAAERCGEGRAAVEAAVARWMEQEPLAVLGRHARPGLQAFLRAARARGLRVGVVSDYPAGDKLAALGVAGLVDAVVCAQDDAVRRFKPDPAGLLEAARRLRCDPAHCLYVGDRPEVDAEAARRAGMPCAVFAPPPAPPARAGAPGAAPAWRPISLFADLDAWLAA